MSESVRSVHMTGLVAGTRLCNKSHSRLDKGTWRDQSRTQFDIFLLERLHSRTSRANSTYKATSTIWRDKSPRLVARIQTSWNSCDKRQAPSFTPCDYNPGRNNMEQKPAYYPPPTPRKSMLKSREEKNAPFCILDWGRGEAVWVFHLKRPRL